MQIRNVKKAIAPILETGAIIEYLKGFRNLGSETQKMQMLAETMAATFRKENERCFTCGDKYHLERDCPKKANKKPTKICPCCHSGMHWAEDCKSKFDIERKPIPGNFKRGTPHPRVPFNKNQGQTVSFPCCQYTSLKWFFPLPSSSPF